MDNSKRELVAREVRRVLGAKAPRPRIAAGKTAKAEACLRAGLGYWAWIDALAELEARFSCDLSACSDKFGIQTADALVEALMNAPALESLWKN
ncbi:MAG: hypothetical protein LBO78_01085 [Rickettsiales bacterium]|jgi:hypothetical protein|nr:hypothetical protein [Rickettsiales bacterium]